MLEYLKQLKVRREYKKEQEAIKLGAVSGMLWDVTDILRTVGAHRPKPLGSGEISYSIGADIVEFNQFPEKFDCFRINGEHARFKEVMKLVHAHMYK